MIKKFLVLSFSILVLVGFSGCTPADRITDTIYGTNIFVKQIGSATDNVDDIYVKNLHTNVIITPSGNVTAVTATLPITSTGGVAPDIGLKYDAGTLQVSGGNLGVIPGLYLTSFTELDPTFTGSLAFGITAANITDWNTAFGWGNHATQGYLTSSFIGSSNITTLGTITTGTWNGSALQDAYIASAGTWNGKENVLTFQQSLTRAGNIINLVGDNSTPGNSQYYGTNSIGNKGFFGLPSTASFVPYTGATATLDLGVHNFTTTGNVAAGTLYVSNNSTFGGVISLDTPTELTVSGGVVTKTKSFHTVDTEGDVSSDDLDTINGGSIGDELVLIGANDAREVQVTDAGNIRFRAEQVIEGFSFNSPAGTSGTFYTAGYDMCSVTGASLTQGSPSITYGTALSPYGAHAILVAGGAGTVNAGTVSIRVSGTSVDEDGVRVASDNETIVANITTMALNQFFETTKVWVGQITYTLVPVGAATYTADFNYGFVAYDSFGKKKFHVTAFEVMGRAGASDTGFNIQFLKHQHTGWIYSAAAFLPDITPLCSLITDYGVDNDLVANERFKYERNLDAIIDGTAGEGFLVRVTTTKNLSVEFMNLSVYADITLSDFHISNSYTAIKLIYNGTYWMEN